MFLDKIEICIYNCINNVFKAFDTRDGNLLEECAVEYNGMISYIKQLENQLKILMTKNSQLNFKCQKYEKMLENISKEICKFHN